MFLMAVHLVVAVVTDVRERTLSLAIAEDVLDLKVISIESVDVEVIISTEIDARQCLI